MKFKFNCHGQEIEIDVRVCNSVLSKAKGLMFKKKSKPLLFIFNRPTRQQIHSFFCKPFYAIWFNGSEIVDEKLIDKWMLNIKPKSFEKFDKLLEIPQGCKELEIFVNK